MSEAEHLPEEADPDSTPFEAPPVEGIPYDRGSEEDEAVKRVIREAESRGAKST
jgi:hypothetical protein